MAIEANKELVRRYYDDWNEGRILETLDRYVAPDVVNRSATPEKGRGLANLRRTLERALAAMPDQRLTPEQIVAEGDLVVVRGTRTAHWRPADFRGVPLARTDLPLATAFVHIFRVEAGKIREIWSLRDELDMAHQLGLRLGPRARIDDPPPPAPSTD